MTWNSIVSALQNDELLSPAAFVLFGALGLLWYRLMKMIPSEFLARHADHPLFRRTFEKFESRTRLSWMLIAFGVLWLAQSLFQSSWAA